MVIELTNKQIILDKYGNADTLSGIEEEKQLLRNTLLIFKGTWFDDTTIGVDWTTILDKGFSANGIKSEIARNIVSLPFVKKLVSINLGTVSNGAVELSFVVTTTSGDTITFSEVL
jgi:hypothetical protein